MQTKRKVPPCLPLFEGNGNLNINPEVDKLLKMKKNPMDAEIRRVREIILSVDERRRGRQMEQPEVYLQGEHCILLYEFHEVCQFDIYKVVILHTLLNKPQGSYLDKIITSCLLWKKRRYIH